MIQQTLAFCYPPGKHGHHMFKPFSFRLNITCVYVNEGSVLLYLSCVGRIEQMDWKNSDKDSGL